MKLFSPLNYLRIQHEEKRWYDYIIPFVGSLLLSIAYYFTSNKISLIGSSGLLSQVNGLLQVLVGFYIAALAAVATFTNSTIDEVMSGDPPTLAENFRGKRLRVELTRRRFVCYLFGYLALVSFVLFCLGVISILTGKTILLGIASIVSVEAILIMKSVYLFFTF